LKSFTSFAIFRRCDSTLAAMLGVVIGWQLVPLVAQALPVKPSANCGVPTNATPRSVDRLK